MNFFYSRLAQNGEEMNKKNQKIKDLDITFNLKTGTEKPERKMITEREGSSNMS